MVSPPRHGLRLKYPRASLPTSCALSTLLRSRWISDALRRLYFFLDLPWVRAIHFWGRPVHSEAALTELSRSALPHFVTEPSASQPGRT